MPTRTPTPTTTCTPEPSTAQPSTTRLSTELPSADVQARAAALFRAMAHEGRLSVLVTLSRRGPRTVSELMEITGLEQSALSHQLKLLREARLVAAERQGKNVVYSLEDTHVSHVLEDAIAHVEHGLEHGLADEAAPKGDSKT